MASWDQLYGVLPAEVPQPIRYFVVFMIVRLRARQPRRVLRPGRRCANSESSGERAPRTRIERARPVHTRTRARAHTQMR